MLGDTFEEPGRTKQLKNGHKEGALSRSRGRAPTDHEERTNIVTTIDNNDAGGRATVPLAPAEELRRAAAKLRATPDSGYSAQLANWLQVAGDNMSDEGAYEAPFCRADGGTFTEVFIDGDCHVGLSSEWTAALGLARAINAAAGENDAEFLCGAKFNGAAFAEAMEALDKRIADERRVPESRVKEILAHLNGMVVRDEPGTHLVGGVEIPCMQLLCDAKLVEAVAWANSQPEVDAAAGPLLGEANVLLKDGTLIEWDPEREVWAVTVSDDAEAVSA